MGDGKAHAKLSASGADRWMRCPGSVRMEENAPDESSTYAEEGTAAHDMAEMCLTGNLNADQLIGQVFNLHTADLTMAEYVQEYVDYVRAIPGELVVEERVDFSPWVKGGFGTSDAIKLHDGTVNVIDLKYGQGVRVDADETYQPLFYGLGVLNDFGDLYNIDKFVLTIVQPRLDHISEFLITKLDLLAWGDRAHEAALATEDPNAPLIPGEKQCRFCKAKSFCSAYAEDKLSAIQEGFETLEQPGKRVRIGELTPEQIGAILPHLKGLDTFVRDFKANAKRLIERGDDVPGHKLVTGRSSRYWIDEDAAAKALIRKLTMKGAYKRELLTVPAAEEILGKGSPILKKHSDKREGASTIVPESDKRPAIVNTIAEGFEIELIEKAA